MEKSIDWITHTNNYAQCVFAHQLALFGIFPILFREEHSWLLGTVISACEKAVRWPEILSIMDGMLPHVSPNEVSLGAAIAACEKAPRC